MRGMGMGGLSTGQWGTAWVPYCASTQSGGLGGRPVQGGPNHVCATVLGPQKPPLPCMGT